ncbi:MAG: hypothetical protein KatS3mg101_0330 [Patescibacteria group bacterium]|nr:MAG: hypothetical protein KatS3mg101_0330 [Patescibacteria group bacterium]
MFTNGLIANSDTQLEFGFIAQLYNHFFVWNDLDNFGSNPGGYLLWGKVIQFLFAQLFGYSYASYLGLAVIVFLHLLFSYQLCLISLQPISRGFVSTLVNIITVIITVLNPLFAYMSVVNITMYLGFVLALGGIVFYLKYIDSPKLTYLIASSLFASLSIADFHSLVLYLIFVALSASFLYLSGDAEIRKRIAKSILVALLLVACLNSHWIFYNLYNLLTAEKFLISNINFSESVSSDVLFYLNNKNHPGYSVLLNRREHSFFQNDILYLINLVVSLVVILISLSYPLFSKKNEKILRFYLLFAFIYVVSLTMVFGPKGPFFLFSFVYNYIPGGVLFRDFYKFFRLISIAELGLITISLSTLNRKLGTKFIFLFLSFLLILRVFTYMPVFRYINRYDIPHDYVQITSLLASDKDNFRYIVFPLTGWMVKYTWSNQEYDMQDPIASMTSKPYLYNPVAYSNSPQTLFNLSLEKKLYFDKEAFARDLRFAGIKYVLLRKDLEPDQLSQISIITRNPMTLLDWNYIFPHLEEAENLKKIGETDNLILYKVKDFDQNYLIYSIDKNHKRVEIKWVQINPASFLMEIDDDLSMGIKAYFIEQYNSNWVLFKLDSSECQVNNFGHSIPYRDIVKYVTSSFKCDVSIISNYARNRLTGKISRSNPSGYLHDVNFNSWELEDQNNDSPNLYAIFYEPQFFFTLGLLISLPTVILALLYLIFYSLCSTFLNIKKCF